MGQIANKLQSLNTAKHAIRKAINDKGGRLAASAPLSAYPGAIKDLPVPGRYEALAWARVVFIDYDGTVLQDTLVKIGDPVKAPAAPVHEHLTFYGWNHDAAELASVQTDMCVGALYTLDRANTQYLYFKAVTELQIRLVWYTSTQPGTVVVDWGDGSQNTFEALTSGIYATHTYANEFSGFVAIKNVENDNYPAGINRLSGSTVELPTPPLFCYDSIIKQRNTNAQSGTGWAPVGGYVLDATLPGTVQQKNEQNYIPSDCKGKVYMYIPTNYGSYDTINFGGPGLYRISMGIPQGIRTDIKFSAGTNGAIIDILELRGGARIINNTYGQNAGQKANSLVISAQNDIYLLSGKYQYNLMRLFVPCFYGSMKRSDYCGMALFFSQGAQSYGATGTVQFELAGLPDEFILWTFGRLANAPGAVTLSLEHAPQRIRTQLSEMLTAKGYTVAY